MGRCCRSELDDKETLGKLLIDFANDKKENFLRHQGGS